MSDSDEKPEVIETYEGEDGHTIARYKSGVLYDVTAGHLLRGPDFARITPETANSMRQRGLDIQMWAKVRAFAREAGVDPDLATEEELLAGYRDTQEAIHKKAYDLFMEAKTSRGVEGLYPQLTRLPGEPEKGTPTYNTVNLVVPPEMLKALQELHRRLVPSSPTGTGTLTMDIIEGRVSPEEK